MNQKSKYWFSSQTFAKGVRWPISKEGWIFTTAYLVIGLIAVFASVPRSQNPTDGDYVPLIIVAIILTCVYITVSTLKAQPKPPQTS